MLFRFSKWHHLSDSGRFSCCSILRWKHCPAAAPCRWLLRRNVSTAQNQLHSQHKAIGKVSKWVKYTDFPFHNLAHIYSSRVFTLSQTEALRILKSASLTSLSKVCIRMHYIPAGEIPEGKLVLRDLCIEVLKQVRRFSMWMWYCETKGLLYIIPDNTLSVLGLRSFDSSPRSTQSTPNHSVFPRGWYPQQRWQWGRGDDSTQWQVSMLEHIHARNNTSTLGPLWIFTYMHVLYGVTTHTKQWHQKQNQRGTLPKVNQKLTNPLLDIIATYCQKRIANTSTHFKPVKKACT